MDKKFSVTSWNSVGGRERRTVMAVGNSGTSSFGLGETAQIIENTCGSCPLRKVKACGGLHGDAGNHENVFNATRKPPKDWPEGINGTIFPCDTL